MEKTLTNQSADRQPGRESLLAWRFIHGLARLLAGLLFRLRITRNELDGVEGPCVVVANHQCMLDFVNLAAAVSRPMRIVISDSFYRTIPFPRLLHRLNPIPKQQFETDLRALKEMLAAVKQGQLLALYPAGLMCEDGLSTPIPRATGKFLKHLGCDVYAARTCGSYFVQPKWGKGLRPGKTTLDIYRLLTAEELRQLSAAQVQQRLEQALLFDAYAEQEQLRAVYRGGSDIRGLENVLYRCPHCGWEFTMAAEGRTHLRCAACGYEVACDKYGFLERISPFGPELRHPSDWSLRIQSEVEQLLRQQPDYTFAEPVEIRLVDDAQRKYLPVGRGVLRFGGGSLTLEGTVSGKPTVVSLSCETVPMLPFVPGKQLELQQGGRSYRCLPDNGRVTIKFITLIKAAHRLCREKKSRRP